MKNIKEINEFTKLKIKPNKWAKIRGAIVFFFFLVICRFNISDAMMRSITYYQNKIKKQHEKWIRDNKDIYEQPGRETIKPKEGKNEI